MYVVGVKVYWVFCVCWCFFLVKLVFIVCFIVVFVRWQWVIKEVVGLLQVVVFFFSFGVLVDNVVCYVFYDFLMRGDVFLSFVDELYGYLFGQLDVVFCLVEQVFGQMYVVCVDFQQNWVVVVVVDFQGGGVVGGEMDVVVVVGNQVVFVDGVEEVVGGVVVEYCGWDCGGVGDGYCGM